MKNKFSGVYQIINEVNGKSYVGSSKDIKNRWKEHKNHFKKEPIYKSYIHSAVKKYGIENFTFLIIEECEPTKEVLETREDYYFELLKPEYNVLKKAYSSLGRIHSEETIEKIRQAHSTDEVKQVHRDYQTQKMADPSNRDQISEAMKVYRAKVPYQGSNVKGSTRHADTGKNIREGQQNSEKRKAHIESQKGKTTAVSSSGEYGVQWLDDRQKWCVRIDNKKYGSFKTIAEAIIKRDEIVALPPEERKVADMKLPSSGERNVIWNGKKWAVKIKNKQYGVFDTIADAVARRNSL